ncbi:MAG: hypothetical protein WCK56_06660 [Alcaligenaceae bacterium]
MRGRFSAASSYPRSEDFNTATNEHTNILTQLKALSIPLVPFHYARP